MADDQNDDLKAKMREALERKKANGPGGKAQSSHDKGHSEEHGAVGGTRMFRRKSGG